jgi:hypothetical protein
MERISQIGFANLFFLAMFFNGASQAQTFCPGMIDTGQECQSGLCALCDPAIGGGGDDYCQSFFRSGIATCSYLPKASKKISEPKPKELPAKKEKMESSEATCNGDAPCEVEYWEKNCAKGGWSETNNKPPVC